MLVFWDESSSQDVQWSMQVKCVVLLGGLLFSAAAAQGAAPTSPPATPRYRIQGSACQAGIIPYLNIVDPQSGQAVSQARQPLIVALNCNVSTNSGYDTESQLTIEPGQTLELCNLLRNNTDKPLLGSTLRLKADQPLDRKVSDYQGKDVLVMINGDTVYATLAADTDAVTLLEDEVTVRLMPVPAHGYAIVCRRVTVAK